MLELRAGSNFESQVPAEAHFGLASASTVSELKVTWPRGGETLLRDVAARQRILVTEPVPSAARCNTPGSLERCIPGGPSSPTECIVEWRPDAVPPTNRSGVPQGHLSCVDGDPSCDADPDGTNASCTFREALCINGADPRLARCAPSAIARGEVLKPKLGKSSDAADAANRAALRAQLAELGLGFGKGVFANATPDHCGTVRDVVVPLVRTKKGKLRPGTRQLAVKVVRPDGKADVDALKFQCRPAS